MDMHSTGLVSTLVVSLVFAFIGGWAARGVGLPPLVGYLFAGIVVGPYTPGFVVDQKVANELAEIGVALLLFNVGLHFSPADLWRTRRVAVPGALVQIAFAILVGGAVAHFVLGIAPFGAALVGLSIAISSTAAATRAIADRGRLDTPAGRIALGWLVVQDIVVILSLVLVPLLARQAAQGSEQWLTALGEVALQVIGFVAAMGVLGRRIIPWLLARVARAGSRELFTLAVIVLALGIASASTLLFGVSLALGAFVAGVVLGESDLSHQAAAETLPIQQVFTVLFFVSIGMLFDPMSLVRLPLQIGALLAAVFLGTGLATLVLLLILRRPPETAALVGTAFAQIGEFSFILSELGVTVGAIDHQTRDVILAAALLSIVVNSVLFRFTGPLALALAEGTPLRLWRRRNGDALPEPVDLSGHAILVGHGRVGRIIAAAMRQHGIAHVIIESDRGRAEKLRAAGGRVIYGDATREEVLRVAAPQQARLLVLALPDAFHARNVVTLARRINPAIETVVRTHSDQEAVYLEKEARVGMVVMGEREVALSMTDFALQSLGVSAEGAQVTVNGLRARSRDGEDLALTNA